jgi:hypothetical protein
MPLPVSPKKGSPFLGTGERQAQALFVQVWQEDSALLYQVVLDLRFDPRFAADRSDIGWKVSFVHEKARAHAVSQGVCPKAIPEPITNLGATRR